MALIRCGECGRQISDKASACPNCGCPVVISRAVVSLTCDECGRRIPNNATACPNCGCPVDGKSTINSVSSSTAKKDYGAVIFGLASIVALVILIAVLRNPSLGINSQFLGEWHNGMDAYLFESDGSYVFFDGRLGDFSWGRTLDGGINPSFGEPTVRKEYGTYTTSGSTLTLNLSGGGSRSYTFTITNGNTLELNSNGSVDTFTKR